MANKRQYRPHMERIEEEWLRPIINVLTVRRIAMGISQEELNHEIGCADNHLTKWETGKYRPSLYFLILWAEALDYNIILKDTTHGSTKTSSQAQG